jgi:hypothetical protein
LGSREPNGGERIFLEGTMCVRCAVVFSVIGILVVPSFRALAQARDSLPATLFAWRGVPRPLGEPGPIVTDRPDFTEASSTVGLGIIQVETGYTFVRDGDTHAHSWGEPLVRVGALANWLEFRVAAFPLTVTDASGSMSRSGFEDLYLGAKCALTLQETFLPEIAVVIQMTVPTGSEEFSDGRVLPGVNLLYGWDLTDDLSLGGSTQFNSALDDHGTRVDEWVQSVALGYGLTDRLGVYAEWYSFHPGGPGKGTTQRYLNGGLAFLATDDLQCDVRGGMGVNDEAEDLFLGVGISFRFR